jgi:hypothetical protein
MKLKDNITVFVGIPWLCNDHYEDYYRSCVDYIRRQDTSVKVLPVWRTASYSGKYERNMPSILYAIMDRMNAVIDRFMSTNATHLWMVDADVEVPPHALETLLNHDADIASGVYPFHNFKANQEKNACRSMMGGRMKNDDPCGFFRPRDWDYMKERVFGIDERVSAGTGCMLVKRRVFKRYHPNIRPLRFDKDEGRCGADVYFWKRCQDLGFTARLDANIICGHLPEYSLSKIEEWLI